MPAIFVTATGTEVGKTYVTAGLIRHYRARGRSVAALKPVASGFDPAHVRESDPGILLTALGAPADPDAVACIAPWRFAAPLSPDLAASRESRAIDFDALTGFCRAAIASAEDVLLIEGIGGIMVPLGQHHTVLDWMTALDIPLLVVGGSYLGAISHMLSTVEVLTGRRLNIRAIVLSESAEGAVSLSDTAASVARFVPPIPIITLPRRDATENEPVFDALADILAL